MITIVQWIQYNSKSQELKNMMVFRFSIFLIIFTLSFICDFPVISAQKDDEDMVIKTMEEFSGYPIHEPNYPNALSSLSVNSESLQKQIDELATFSDSPAPSVTRILYSEKDALARRYIKNLMELSGLSVREDAVGNIFGRWNGYEPELAPVLTGSHIDAIPYSGKYDGVVGVLGALEAINVLKRSGFKPMRSLEVIMFTSEEPTRFGISCLGSRLLAGSVELAELLKKTVDSQNVSFSNAAMSAGYANAKGDMSEVFLKKGSYSAFIELHIEQGPILEEGGTSIGIVTAIAAPASIKVTFEGNGGHAGAVLMPSRVSPMGMIFIPCYKSNRIQSYSSDVRQIEFCLCNRTSFMSSVKEYGCTSQAQRARTKLIKEVQENFKVDAFIGDVGDWEKVCVRNLVGMPVVVVPTAFKKISDAPSDDTRRKTTITTGIYAPPDHDHVALALAMTYQSVTNHHKQRPPIDDIGQTTLFQTRPQPLYLQDNYVVIDLYIWFNINVLKLQNDCVCCKMSCRRKAISL